jgi:hypothetical protein
VNRDHVVTVAVRDRDARFASGYEVATVREVSLLMSDGRFIRGSVSVRRPEGRDRLSDWARHGDRFRYIESAGAQVIVNANHIVEPRGA